mgnify:CR=1 FL=1
MNKAFTLIELLVVVAIIGILAAVGVTTFGGFQEKAKASATKANHKNVVKYVNSEIMKCNLGDEKILENTLDCSDLNHPSQAINRLLKAVVTLLQPKYTNAWQPNHSNIVYSSGIYLGGSCKNNDQNLGIICFYGDSNNRILNVEVCYKTSCRDPDNILLSKVILE